MCACPLDSIRSLIGAHRASNGKEEDSMRPNMRSAERAAVRKLAPMLLRISVAIASISASTLISSQREVTVGGGGYRVRSTTDLHQFLAETRIAFLGNVEDLATEMVPSKDGPTIFT